MTMKPPRPNRRYCEMCDEWFPLKTTSCPACGMPMQAHEFCAACDREGASAGAYLTDLAFHTCSGTKSARLAK